MLFQKIIVCKTAVSWSSAIFLKKNWCAFFIGKFISQIFRTVVLRPLTKDFYLWTFSANIFRELERTETKTENSKSASCLSGWGKKLHILPGRSVSAQSDQCKSNSTARRIPLWVLANVVCEANATAFAENSLSLVKYYVIVPTEFLKYSQAKKLPEALAEEPQSSLNKALLK